VITADRDALLADALGRGWYHTIDVGGGRATPGTVDLRGVAPRILPASLAGRRALDIGTFDGFWAFELERRGATEVLAADLDRFDEAEWPPLTRARIAARVGDSGPGERFGLAHALLGSQVRRVVSAAYDLEPERLGGLVDDVVLGDLLLHLRDPVRGLEAVHGVLRPGGRLFLLEEVSVALTLVRPRAAWASFQARGTDYNWWQGNLRCLLDWLALAGFTGVRRRFFYKLRATKDQARWHVALEATRP
jgi:SAM-dependent methyltransferase